ncbi:MAG: WG repeat-containing protein, partial [Bacteroidetes bacterium]|nr:WG repeat-containing protein [Bacteroidota bacterium]
AYFLQYCHKTERYGFRQGFLNREYYDPYDFVDVKGIEKGMCIVREAETGWGVIDRNHYTILKFEFDTVIENHSHNLFLVQKAGLFGFYNNHGYQMISCQYEEAEPFSEGFAPVMYKGKWGFIDVLDNFVIEPVYEKVEDFSEGKVFVIPFGEKATGGFFIDKKGQQVSEKYHSGSSFRNGMAAVFNGKKWGYLNTDFKVAIDFQYDDAFGFDTYPFTAVRIEDNWQYINRRGIRIFDANNDFKFVK